MINVRWIGRVLSRAVLLGAFLWLVAAGTVIMERRALIYPLSQAFDARTIDGLTRGRVETLTGSDGTPLSVWVAPPVGDRPTILHFTGNAGYTPAAARTVTPYVIRGYGAVLLNYRGAGGAPGEPSEERFVADALTVYDALPRLLGTDRPPVIQGVSLGAAVAVAVAAERPAAALILTVPFARVCEVAQHHYRWLPACLLQWDETWESTARVGAVSAPILVVEAGRDNIIQAGQATALYDAAPEPKRLLRLPDAGHGDFQRHGAVEAVLAFLEQHGL